MLCSCGFEKYEVVGKVVKIYSRKSRKFSAVAGEPAYCNCGAKFHVSNLKFCLLSSHLASRATMPPLIPKSSMSFLASGSKIIPPIRLLSTSTSLSAIGPENPKFIEIPLAPQRFAHPPRVIKGTLPPPRNLFPSRKADKTTPEYLAAVTPEPTAERHFAEPSNDRIAWKRRMAASRRTNLREGIVELHKRRVEQEAAVAKLSSWRSRNRHWRLNAPQREDERLTSPTITQSTRQLQKGPLPDPGREARLAKIAENTKAKAAVDAEQRKDALHTLYMHARNFITTEEELDAEIAKIFVPYPFQENDRHSLKTNIWDAHGAPPTVQDMLSTTNNTQKEAIQYHRGPALITGARLKRIGEELTGGKMD
jgi:hypothetical protein